MKEFRNKRIAVIGDVMLDRFLEGRVTRKSPEANRPVVFWDDERDVLGGAANVAANVSSLGGKAELFSVVGDDEMGRAIAGLLSKARIESTLLIDRSRRSTLKTRIFADGDYLIRLDRETKDLLPKKLSERLTRDIIKKLKNFDAIVFSDYDKGLFSKSFVAPIIMEARKRNIPIVADIKPQNLSHFKGVTVVKPNLVEALLMSGAKNEVSAGEIISKKIGADVLITLGRKGMILCERKGAKIKKIKSVKAKRVDIVGAGDVVSACLALGLSSGMNFLDSAEVANKAAALSVEKHGTVAVTAQELKQVLKQK